MQDLHIRGQMPQNGPSGHDDLYKNMISMDLWESAPESKIYPFLARWSKMVYRNMISMDCKKLEDLHILGQMPKNGPRDHDSLYENMISMDLQETAPVCQIPRTAHNAFQENHGNLSKTMPKDSQKQIKIHQKS